MSGALVITNYWGPYSSWFLFFQSGKRLKCFFKEHAYPCFGVVSSYFLVLIIHHMSSTNCNLQHCRHTSVEDMFCWLLLPVLAHGLLVLLWHRAVRLTAVWSVYGRLTLETSVHHLDESSARITFSTERIEHIIDQHSAGTCYCKVRSQSVAFSNLASWAWVQTEMYIYVGMIFSCLTPPCNDHKSQVGVSS